LVQHFIRFHGGGAIDSSDVNVLRADQFHIFF
jgi:hypothetical protein